MLDKSFAFSKLLKSPKCVCAVTKSGAKLLILMIDLLKFACNRYFYELKLLIKYSVCARNKSIFLVYKFKNKTQTNEIFCYPELVN